MLASSWRVRTRSAVVLSAIAVLLWCMAASAADLPDGRAYELVSPSDKLGTEISAESSRTHATATESPGLPAAVTFAALGGFSDVQGTGIAAEYLSERDGLPGTSGWSSHGITPRQDPLSYLGVISGGEPSYRGDMSDDLTHGIFRAWSPLTDAPNVAHVPNLYDRSDLRTPGAGAYQLLTDAVAPLAAPVFGVDIRQFVDGTSDDFRHVLFETKLNLTSDARGTTVKLYKADDGVARLITPAPTCPGLGGANGQSPCSAGGQGAFTFRYTDRTLSSDGSRANFMSPVTGGGGVLSTSGAASKLFQLDDRGTAGTADDAMIQLDASEAASPGVTQAATFQTASTDGSRVFFITAEQLTDAPGGGLYMWARQPTDASQTVTVDATGGSFTLTAHTQPSHGSGTLTNGSTQVTSVSGSFSVGQTIHGTGIPEGTTIAAIPSSTRLTLSAPAAADGGTTLDASVDATTTPLPWDATAAQLQGALEGLGNIGAGNVTVTGGSGVPYVVTFVNALAGVNVAPLTADDSSLTGGTATATVAVTRAVHNLTLIASLSIPSAAGTLGASSDGHRLYFLVEHDQLVAGGPPVTDRGVYYWQDTDGRLGGTLSFVGGLSAGDADANRNASQWNTTPKVARVTPDGKTLVFEVSDGSQLAPRYDQSHCNGGLAGNANNNSAGGCSEVYVYRADGSTPTVPNLVCASCIPGGVPATATAWLNIRVGASATTASTHLSHALSDDGHRVFFSTTDALVPEDTNGKSDVYEYDVPSGTVHMISTGVDTSDSYFLDASADGHDVYFVTRQQLVGWDTDNAYDLYDARVGGGFPEPPSPPAACSGDACQGQVLAPPPLAAVGSSAFAGAGNARAVLRRRKAPVRCKRGTVRRKLRGKVRCVRRAKSKRHAKKTAHHARNAKQGAK